MEFLIGFVVGSGVGYGIKNFLGANEKTRALEIADRHPREYNETFNDWVRRIQQYI